MINADETRPPVPRGGRINADETIPPGGEKNGGGTVRLVSGESVGDSYVIHSPLQESGKQSRVYLAKRWGKSYVVKLYRDGWRPSPRMQNFLTNVNHKNIARVASCGEYAGHYYEIYDYYPEGTLGQAGALPGTQIQNVVVPSVNEGLHELHKNGIVHCDIKPDNLFFADDHGRVVIGDCGISGYAGADGKLVDSIRGTPEYAPPVKAILWSASLSPAYDYGSFGLVVCRMLLGFSLFEGMSVEAIARAWENGIELPSQIGGRFRTLVTGLLQEEEDARWGYPEVKRWCEGEFQRPVNRNLYAGRKKEPENRPFIFGKFDGQMLTVRTLHELAQAVKSHWDQAARIVKRQELPAFVRQFDQKLTEDVRRLARYQDADAAVFQLLTWIDDDGDEICYAGTRYASLADYVERLESGTDEGARRFLATGLLVWYLREKGYERGLVDRLEQMIQRNGCEDMTAICTICFALQGKQSVRVFGETVETLDSLVPVLSRHTTEEIAGLLAEERFLAWMNRLGYGEEMRQIRKGWG